MKRIFMMAVAGLFLMPPVSIEAQYSNSSLNGPWIAGVQNSMSYILFDGNGTINALGNSDDSVFPVGSYQVQPGGSLTASLNLAGGTQSVTGTLTSATSATIYIDATGPYSLSQVTNIALLADTFAGTVYDSASQVTKQIEIAIDNTGNVSFAGGVVPGLGGKIFSEHNIFSGYLTSTDTACSWQCLQLWGSVHNKVLQGPAKLGGSSLPGCKLHGSVFLSKVSTGQTGLAGMVPAPDFLVYPNPFNNQVMINGLASGSTYNITLTDMEGRTIAQQRITGGGGATGLHINEGSSGIYLLRITGGENVTTIKVVKQ